MAQYREGRSCRKIGGIVRSIEGLPTERLVGCLGCLLQWLPLPVDLVDLESASPQLRDRIVKEGVTV